MLKMEPTNIYQHIARFSHSRLYVALFRMGIRVGLKRAGRRCLSWGQIRSRNIIKSPRSAAWQICRYLWSQCAVALVKQMFDVYNQMKYQDHQRSRMQSNTLYPFCSSACSGKSHVPQSHGQLSSINLFLLLSMHRSVYAFVGQQIVTPGPSFELQMRFCATVITSDVYGECR